MGRVDIRGNQQDLEFPGWVAGEPSGFHKTPGYHFLFQLKKRLTDTKRRGKKKRRPEIQ